VASTTGGCERGSKFSGHKFPLEVLRSAVSTALIDRLGVTWDERFGELKRYKERVGDCNVPGEWQENPQLASWVCVQRSRKDKGKLSPERSARLDTLGFVWDPFDSAWEIMFSELHRYKERFGHCNVPRPKKEKSQLGAWVGKQRALQNKEMLSSARKARLDALGFAWEPLVSKWDAMLGELRGFKDEHSDCNVPVRWEKNPKLGEWVDVQRQFEKTGRLSPLRKARLDDAGFVWDPFDSAWETMFTELQRYREQFGDLNVPAKCEANPPLGIWAHNQRRKQKTRRLSPERKARLDEAGFAWETRSDAWGKMFAKLKCFKDETATATSLTM
jgi:uncharacterized protein (DUF2384 family)